MYLILTLPDTMGGPNLEVFRMAIYVFMPVGMFYYFNLPQFYENNVKTKLVCGVDRFH